MANTTLREAESTVIITGILKKKELQVKTFSNGEALSGHLIIETTPGNEVRVDTFVNRMTRATNDKPARESTVWKNQVRILDEYVSMAELMKSGADEETARQQATRFTVRARLGLNDYVGRDGNMVSTPRVSSNVSFYSRIAEGTPFTPGARFDIEGYVTEKRPEMKGDDETGRLVLGLIVPGYQGAVQPMSFVTTESAASYIDEHYEVGNTVRVYGELVNRVNVITTRKAGFTRDEISEEKTYVNEMLIDNGALEPYDEDGPFAYKREDIEAAMRVRELEYLPSVKKKAAERPVNSTTPVAAPMAGFANMPPRSTTGFNF